MFHWQFSSRQERPASWYVIALIVTLFFIVYGIVTGLYMMSVVTFLLAGVYIMKENNTTPITQVSIGTEGIQVHESFYNYADIISFSVVYSGAIAHTLRLNLRKGISTILDIPLTSDVNPSELKSYLFTHLEENTNTTFSKTDKMIQAMKL